MNIVAPISRAVLDAVLLDSDSESVLWIGKGKQHLTLELTNLTQSAITIGKAGQAKLVLTFRPGALERPKDMTASGDGWTGAFTGQEFPTLTLTHPQGVTLAAGARQAIQIGNMMPSGAGGSRSTRADLEYSGVKLQGAAQAVQGRRTLHFSLLNPRAPAGESLGSIAESGPFKAEVVGTSDVLVGGMIQNEIKVKITARSAMKLIGKSGDDADAAPQLTFALPGEAVNALGLNSFRSSAKKPKKQPIPKGWKREQKREQERDQFGRPINKYKSVPVRGSVEFRNDASLPIQVMEMPESGSPLKPVTSGYLGKLKPHASPNLNEDNRYGSSNQLVKGIVTPGLALTRTSTYKNAVFIVRPVGGSGDWTYKVVTVTGENQIVVIKDSDVGAEITPHQNSLNLKGVASFAAGASVAEATLTVKPGRAPGIYPLEIGYKNTGGRDGRAVLMLNYTGVGVTAKAPSNLTMAYPIAGDLSVTGKLHSKTAKIDDAIWFEEKWKLGWYRDPDYDQFYLASHDKRFEDNTQTGVFVARNYRDRLEWLTMLDKPLRIWNSFDHPVSLGGNANVGIGTDQPKVKLDVNGEIRATSGVSISNWKIAETGLKRTVRVGVAGDIPKARANLLAFYHKNKVVLAIDAKDGLVKPG